MIVSQPGLMGMLRMEIMVIVNQVVDHMEMLLMEIIWIVNHRALMKMPRMGMRHMETPPTEITVTPSPNKNRQLPRMEMLLMEIIWTIKTVSKYGE